jgi:hemoglobin
MTLMDTRSIYDQMGGEPGIRALVTEFYRVMDTLPEAKTIRDMHHDLGESAEKLIDFLSGWSGGPPLYHLKRGNPMLRARHLPFAIGQAEADQWMLCMQRALEKMNWNYELCEQLLSAFKRVAQHMKNQ